MSGTSRDTALFPFLRAARPRQFETRLYILRYMRGKGRVFRAKEKPRIKTSFPERYKLVGYLTFTAPIQLSNVSGSTEPVYASEKK